MTATANWYEQNGTATGSPAHGAESSISSCLWKSVDDATTSEENAPIEAGENSYTKYNYVKFTGVFNKISDVKFAHTAGSLGDGITLKGKISSTYATPVASDIEGASDISTPINIASGANVLLGTSGPNDANPASFQTSACYTQYIITQAQVAATATAGNSGTATLTVRYKES
jgi:hypothetical protein